MDQLQTRHTQTALTHLVDFTGGLKVTTSAYYNYFWRNWYKLNDVRIGDQKGEKRSIEEILADPETNARYIDILTGATDRLGEALMLRANQRSYHSRGIQTKVEYRLPFLSSYLQLEAGARYHADLEDRFQHDDSYSIEGGEDEPLPCGPTWLAEQPHHDSPCLRFLSPWEVVTGGMDHHRWASPRGRRAA